MKYDVDYEVIDLVDYYNYNNEYLQVYGVDTIFSVLEDDNFSNTIKKIGNVNINSFIYNDFVLSFLLNTSDDVLVDLLG